MKVEDTADKIILDLHDLHCEEDIICQQGEILADGRTLY